MLAVRRSRRLLGTLSTSKLSHADLLTNRGVTIQYGAVVPDETALRDTAEMLSLTEQSGDDLAVDVARSTRGVALIHCDTPHREAGLSLLAEIRDKALSDRFASLAVPVVDVHIAKEKARSGDLDGAIGLARAVLDGLPGSRAVWNAVATGVLVDALLQRGSEADLRSEGSHRPVGGGAD